MRASSAVSAASIAPFCPVARAFSRSASAAAIFCFSCSCDTATCPACARMHSYVRARMRLCARTRFVSRAALRHAAHVRCATCSSSSFSFAAASFVSACHAAWDTYHAGRDRATSGSCLPRPRPSYRPPASPSAASAPSAPPPRWPAPPPPRRYPKKLHARVLRSVQKESVLQTWAATTYTAVCRNHRRLPRANESYYTSIHSKRCRSCSSLGMRSP